MAFCCVMYSDSQTNIPFEANDINRQQPGSAVNTLIDHGKIESIKTLSGCRALCCDEHQFRAKMMANTCTVLSYCLNKLIEIKKG